MATSLLALLDDITTVLDDVALLTKLSAKKTAGVLGDDLALNAEQVTGVHSNRELPVVWAVAKGSLRNKAILVPLALLISAFAPWAIAPLLMVGGAYLCFEGVEKVAHAVAHRGKAEDAERAAELQRMLSDPTVDPREVERDKVAGAIRTDFVLSAEIITIALGVVADADLLTRLVVLSGVAVIITAGVYGIVAAIVKLDDLGLLLRRRGQGAIARVGDLLVASAPWLMKFLSVVGTLAMFLVGGGILVHGLAPLHHLREAAGAASGAAGWLVSAGFDLVAGVVLGTVVLGIVGAVRRLWAKRPSAS